jgi:hypothetical protein
MRRSCVYGDAILLTGILKAEKIIVPIDEEKLGKLKTLVRKKGVQCPWLSGQLR